MVRVTIVTLAVAIVLLAVVLVQASETWVDDAPLTPGGLAYEINLHETRGACVAVHAASDGLANTYGDLHLGADAHLHPDPHTNVYGVASCPPHLLAVGPQAVRRKASKTGRRSTQEMSVVCAHGN